MAAWCQFRTQLLPRVSSAAPLEPRAQGGFAEIFTRDGPSADGRAVSDGIEIDYQLDIENRAAYLCSVGRASCAFDLRATLERSMDSHPSSTAVIAVPAALAEVFKHTVAPCRGQGELRVV